MGVEFFSKPLETEGWTLENLAKKYFKEGVTM